MIRLVFEGDPIGYYDCGNRQSRGGEEDDQSSAEDNASGQHPSVVVYVSHFALWGGAPNKQLAASSNRRLAWGSGTGSLM